MTTQTYLRMIVQGIRDLPAEALAEILDFVLFLRKRTLDPESFEREVEGILLNAELAGLSRDEQAHLEAEFEDYDRNFPRE
jgi:hypothetical protein